MIDLRGPAHPAPSLRLRWSLVKAAAQGRPIVHRVTVNFQTNTVEMEHPAFIANCRFIGARPPKPHRSAWWHFWWGFTHPFGPRSRS